MKRPDRLKRIAVIWSDEASGCGEQEGRANHCQRQLAIEEIRGELAIRATEAVCGMG